MKLHELLEGREDTTTKIKLMLRRAKKRNPKFGKQNKFSVRGAEDSFTGYSTNSFDRTTWK